MTPVRFMVFCVRRGSFLERRLMNSESIASATARRFAWTNTSINGSRRSESYESLLAKCVRPSLGKKPLVGIRPFDVQGVYQAMSDRGLSPSVLFYVVVGTSIS